MPPIASDETPHEQPSGRPVLTPLESALIGQIQTGQDRIQAGQDRISMSLEALIARTPNPIVIHAGLVGMFILLMVLVFGLLQVRGVNVLDTAAATKTVVEASK